MSGGRALSSIPNLEATTMAILPADEDYARAVLTIFRGSRVQAKQSLKSSQVKAEFLSHNLGRAPDYDAAVEYALEQGWVTLQLGAIRLTEAGFAELWMRLPRPAAVLANFRRRADVLLHGSAR